MAGVGERVLGVHFVGSPSSCWLGGQSFPRGKEAGRAGPSEGTGEPTCALSFGGRCLSLWAVSMFILQVELVLVTPGI